MEEPQLLVVSGAVAVVGLVIHSSLFRVSGFLLIFPLCFWFLFYLPAYQAIDEEASCRQAFFLFAIVHVCCYACFLTNFFTDFPTVFGSFLFSPAIDEEASSRQVFSPFAVMHVCFVDICFYLEGFNFICCCACFLLHGKFTLFFFFTFADMHGTLYLEGICLNLLF